MENPRVLCWFSCGIISAVAAKYAVDKYGSSCEVIYCDTLKYEHPDNSRFMKDIEQWLGIKIKIINNPNYSDIFDVFNKTKYLNGVMGARCTLELKKLPRRRYQRDGDIHIFGFSVEEAARAKKLELSEPDLTCDHLLIDNNITRADCHRIIAAVGIKRPVMYDLGYNNNNCVGCVKGGKGYWNKIRIDFPEVFDRMAKQERKLYTAISKKHICGVRFPVFLDELKPTEGSYKAEPLPECGVLCSTD
jgi:3'-phosphoadenosine 5'-phosphosulfate sulfotransferase (PAPS reductase)/FAD synthetase